MELKELFEPIRKSSQKSSRIVVVFSLLVGSTLGAQAHADYFSKEISRNSKSFFEGLLTSPKNNLSDLVQKAENIVEESYGIQKRYFWGTNAEKNTFETYRVVGDPFTSTVKLSQKYQGLEVLDGDAFVHFDSNGNLKSKSLRSRAALNTVEPRLSQKEAVELVSNYFATSVQVDGTAALKLIPVQTGEHRLAYEIFTKTNSVHSGHRVFVDAQSGEILLETPRAYALADDAPMTVYRADTDEARMDGRIDKEDGAPMDINFMWYVKSLEDGRELSKSDSSVSNADSNARMVYDYYQRVFKRKSFDDKNSRITSVVHVGLEYNNAFWTDEYQVMGYGDGDGKLKDLSQALDVAAHEMTHAVTSSTANLMYRAESGALNESYSDFFAKMVDRDSGNWYIGAKIVGPKINRKALRNMINPEEFKQPGSTDSSYRVPTSGRCRDENDFCGVHKNSGIPNKASALIAEAIGKDKAERLYYNVLSQRLKPLSDFAEARKFTEEACAEMFGADSKDCFEVTKAFDTVRM